MNWFVGVFFTFNIIFILDLLVINFKEEFAVYEYS